jgi:hypothetical protein
VLSTQPSSRSMGLPDPCSIRHGSKGVRASKRVRPISFSPGILPSLEMLGIDPSPFHLSISYHLTFRSFKQGLRLKIYFSWCQKILIHQYDIDVYIFKGLDYFLQYSYSIYYLSYNVTIQKNPPVWIGFFLGLD